MNLSEFASSELFLILLAVVIVYAVLRVVFKAGVFVLVILVLGAVLLGYSLDGWVDKGKNMTKKGFNAACEDGALTPAQIRSLKQERAQARQELKNMKRAQNPQYYDRLTARISVINGKLAQNKTCATISAN